MPQRLHRARVSVNLGPNALIETIDSAFGDLSAVCQFSGKFQQQASRMQAVRKVLRDPDRWVEAEAFERLAPFPSFALRYPSYLRPYGYLAIEQAVDRYMQERGLDNGDIAVESLSYHNPLELVISVGAVSFAVLRLICELRDWPARRRINNAAAAEFEDTARARRKIRSALVERMVSGDQPIPSDLIDNLLTDGVIGSIQALTRADMQVEELEQSSREADQED